MEYGFEINNTSLFLFEDCLKTNARLGLDISWVFKRRSSG